MVWSGEEKRIKWQEAKEEGLLRVPRGRVRKEKVQEGRKEESKASCGGRERKEC